MPMISPCIEPGCTKLCMGLFCIEHDAQPAVEFPRGRPWPPAQRLAQTIAPSTARLVQLTDFKTTINCAPMSTSLLGMSFLSRLEPFQVRGSQLILRWRDGDRI